MNKLLLAICSIFVSVLFCTIIMAQNAPSAQQLNNIAQKIGTQSSSGTTAGVRSKIPNSLPSSPINGVANIISGGNNNSLSKVLSTDEAISVDGYPIQFIWPNNPAGSNLCGSPWPEVQIPGNAKNGGCPFNVPCDNPTNRDANIPAGPDPVKFMQLRWTIIRNAAGDPSSNISLTRVNDLMTELNNDYASWKLEFCLDVVNFVNDGTHYNFNGSDEAAMKSTYGANFSNVINIYVVNNISNPSAGGYAYFPYSGYGGYNYRGGILMSRSNSTVGTHTLAHELGHTFGLHHTFHGVDEVGSCSACYEDVGAADGSPASGDDHGDYCSDTNPHETNSYSCNTNPGGSNGCDAFPWANVPVDNHMSYSFCSSQFTPHQAGRMHCMIDTYVPLWVVNGSVTCGTLPPVANFTGSPGLWPAPSAVGFVNLTAGKSTVTAWSWNFDVQNVGGVTPATSTVQDPPAVVYANPGLYEIRLIATNPNGTDSLVRTDYIEVVGPIGDCDTLDFQWENPTPTFTYLPYGPGDFADGVPCATLNASATDPLGMYERFPTPNPGSTVVGGVRMALGFLADANDDMTVDISIYTDDGTGAPNLSTGYLGGVTGLSPTTDLNVPSGLVYAWRNWAFDPPVLITSSKFHIGIEIYPGSAADTLVLITSGDGEGENDTSNYVNTTNFGLLSYLNGVGQDLDLAIIPFLGGYGPDARITTYGQTVSCDTTTVVYFDTTWYQPGISWQFDFADGTTFTDTVDPMALAKTYTSPGPDTVTIAVFDACGKGNSHTYIIPYYFNQTPAGDFTKDLSNPICLPPPTSNCATFTATPADQFAYTWNFGDGTTFTDTSDVLQYCFTGPGTYYVDMSVTGYVDEPTDTIFYEDFSTGIGSFNTFDVDGLNPEVNPPFDGTNSTAWVGNSALVPGLAISTSWYNPVGTSDDWMISSAIVLNASSTLRWAARAYSSAYPDGYEVRISTTSQSVAGCLANPPLFTTTAENTYYSPRKIDLALAGYKDQTVYIGFRNTSNDMYILGIDNVLVSFSGAGCVGTVQKLDYVDIVDCSVTLPTAAMITPSPISGCDSATITFIDNSTGSPTSWIWDFNDGNFSTAQNPPPHTYTAPGTYNVLLIVENTGGVDTAFYTINIYTTPAMPTAGTNTTYCEGDAVTDLTATGSSIEWFSDSGLSSSLGTGSPFTPTVSVGVNTYYVTQTTNGCQSPANSVVLTVNQAATVAAGSDASICEGDSYALSGAIGGSAGSSTWTSSGTGGFSDASLLTAIYSPSVGDIAGGIVTLTLTTDDPDAGGPCSAGTDNLVLTINAAPTASISASSNISCLNGSDGTATVSGSGGTGPYTYLWDDVGTQTTAIATGLMAGTYGPTVTDANGCSNTTTITLTEPGTAVSAVTGTIDASCGNPDGKAYVTASGGTGSYTYVWDDPGTQTTDTAFNLLANNYNVTVTDANGCNVVVAAAVSDAGAPVATISNVINVTCNGGSDGEATVSATGGATPYTYGWSTGGTGTTETGLSAGPHSATVTDNAGCVATVNVVITEPPAIVIGSEIVVDITCNGLIDGTINIAATGGTGILNYSIDSGSTYPNTTGLFPALTAGSYVVFVQDSSGCTQIGMTLTIIEPSAINITTQTSTNVTCNNDDDGTILIQANGGTGTLMFSIDSGTTTTDTTGSFGPLMPGTYGIYVEDANGCSVTGSNLVITEPTVVSIDSSIATNITCNGDGDGSITITANGGTGVLNYSINGGSTFSSSGTFSPLLAGTNYGVVVEDANGCSVTGSTLTITEPGVLVLNTASVDATCGQSDGEVSVSPMGGTGAYSYEWNDSGSSVTDTVTGLPAATYSVTVTDANGCTANSTSTVSNTGAGTPNITVDNDATCNGGCDGEATIAMTNGSAPFTYAWDDLGTQTVATATGLCAGTFGVTITDAASCVTNDNVTISEPTAIVPIITIQNTESGTCLGSATASSTGGNGSYTYLWNDGQTGAIADSLCPGPIGLTVTDASGCSVTATDTIGSFTGILDPSLNDMMLSINPNPNRGRFQVEYAFGKITDIEIIIYDKIGSLVIAKEVIAATNGTMLIDLSDKANGIYFIHVITNAGATVRRVSVIK